MSRARNLIAALLALAAVGTAEAGEAPRPPCDGAAPVPAYAPVGAQPAVTVWTEKALEQPGLPHIRLEAGASLAGQPPPPCTDWPSPAFAVALSARFLNPGGVEAIVQRFAAVSALERLPYWAAARHHWEPLFDAAYAVRVPSSRERRQDFSPEELRPGRDLYLYQDPGGPVGGAVYRMRVAELRPDRLSVVVENVTSARVLGLFPLPAGAVRFAYIFERQPEEGAWGYYGLLGLATTPDSARTYVNRSAALHRHLTGIPPQQEPPVWP